MSNLVQMLNLIQILDRGQAEFVEKPAEFANLDSTITEPESPPSSSASPAFDGATPEAVVAAGVGVVGVEDVGEEARAAEDPQEALARFAEGVWQVGPVHLDCATDVMPASLGAPSPQEYPLDLWPPFLVYLYVERGPKRGMAEVIVDLHLRRNLIGKRFAENDEGSQICGRGSQRVPWKGRGLPFSFARTMALSVGPQRGASVRTANCGLVPTFTYEIILGRAFAKKAGFCLTHIGDGFPTRLMYASVLVTELIRAHFLSHAI